MYLDDYEYGNRPYTTAKIFDVHALSKDDFLQYIGPNSYTHNYLNKINPKQSNNFETALNPTHKKSYSTNINFNPCEEMKEPNEISLNNFNKFPEIVSEIQEDEKQSDEILEKEKKDFGYKTSNAFFSNLKKSTNIQNKSIILNKSTINFNHSISNLDPLTRRLNFTSNNFKRTENNDYNYTRFDKNYLSNIKIISSQNFFKDKYVDENKKKYDGFKSFNVPRLEKIKENLQKDTSKPTYTLAQKIAKSCVGFKKISYELPHSKAKVREVREENEKLNSIIKNQMNSEFLERTHLPKISYIVNQPKLKIKKTGFNEKIKYMGGKYNPYNFQAGRDCETNRRNLMGALFQH